MDKPKWENALRCILFLFNGHHVQKRRRRRLMSCQPYIDSSGQPKNVRISWGVFVAFMACSLGQLVGGGRLNGAVDSCFSIFLIPQHLIFLFSNVWQKIGPNLNIPYYLRIRCPWLTSNNKELLLSLLTIVEEANVNHLHNPIVGTLRIKCDDSCFLYSFTVWLFC